jgi:N-acetylmuramoyl-L-alanine amidase
VSEIYSVVQGDCLHSIAYHFGFGDWRTIYDDPHNADFRALRPDPNLIYPGDELYIPDFTPRDDSCPTDINHKFKLLVQPTYINLRIQDLADQAIAGARYILKLEKLEVHGKTDPDGWVKRPIPPDAQFGTLRVWPNSDDHDTFFEWEVRLGHLDPLDTTSGVKGRLNNLGYDCGDVDSTEDDLYDQVVRQFQQDHNLKVDGIVGPQTRHALKKEHRI